MQEIYYVLNNIEIVKLKESSEHLFTFLGYTTDTTPILVVFNIKIQAFISIYPFFK
jgi:hypothetical protein